MYAFELALALQKLGLDKLKAMHGLADQSDDYQVGQGAAGAAVAGLLNVAGADVAALFMSAAVLVWRRCRGRAAGAAGRFLRALPLLLAPRAAPLPALLRMPTHPTPFPLLPALLCRPRTLSRTR